MTFLRAGLGRSEWGPRVLHGRPQLRRSTGNANGLLEAPNAISLPFSLSSCSWHGTPAVDQVQLLNIVGSLFFLPHVPYTFQLKNFMSAASGGSSRLLFRDAPVALRQAAELTKPGPELKLPKFCASTNMPRLQTRFRVRCSFIV